MDRTMRLHLHPTPEQKTALLETLQHFTAAFNLVCGTGWQQQEKNGVRLHHLTYSETKATCPGLVSDLLIQARVKATEAVKSACALQAKGKKVRQPHSKLCPARYNVHTYTVHWAKAHVNLSSTAGRLIVPFTVAAYAQKYLGAPVATADLCYRKGTCSLHIVIRAPVPDSAKSDAVVGVDLGLNHPAVTSTRRFLGQRRWKEIEQRRFRLKRALQSKGTKSAKRHLKQLSGKHLRFHRDCDHVLSKQIVQRSPAGATIVLENLTPIRQRVKQRKGKQQHRLHRWSFAQLKGLITYKAEERGQRVVTMDPRHTSQTCSACGQQSRHNRRSQALFSCRQCGYTLHADLNAAKNIAAKHRASLGTPLAGGLSSSSLSFPLPGREGQAHPL
jgi:IS605 OrfB family transposase